MTSAAPIVVVGGGPSGCACARNLALSGHEVHLLIMGRSVDCHFRESVSPGVVRMLTNEGFSLPVTRVSPLQHFWVSWGSDDLELKTSHFWEVNKGFVLCRPD